MEAVRIAHVCSSTLESTVCSADGLAPLLVMPLMPSLTAQLRAATAIAWSAAVPSPLARRLCAETHSCASSNVRGLSRSSTANFTAPAKFCSSGSFTAAGRLFATAESPSMPRFCAR
eukprot:5356104-Prymnesium_polylepis.4